MNENVKEKWYFFDEMTSSKSLSAKEITILILLPFIIGLIAAIIYYNININKFEYEINSYSYENLERLDKVCDIFITEGYRFDLTYIPEDVTSYNVDYDGDKTELHYSLKYYEDFDYAPSLYMDVTLSKDLKVLEKSKSYESEEDYIKTTKSSFHTMSVIVGLLITPTCIAISYTPAMLIGMLISYIHKRIDLSKESKRETEG